MIGNSRKVYTAFAETNDVSKVCPSLHFVTTFPRMQRAFFSRVDSGAPRVKRASGAPWVNKSTHPRKFGNHVTDRLTVRPHHRHANVYSHFLATLGAQEKADCTPLLRSIDSCQNRVSADLCHMTVTQDQVSTHQVCMFFLSYLLTSYWFSNDRRLKWNFFSMHRQ